MSTLVIDRQFIQAGCTLMKCGQWQDYHSGNQGWHLCVSVLVGGYSGISDIQAVGRVRQITNMLIVEAIKATLVKLREDSELDERTSI